MYLLKKNIKKAPLKGKAQREQFSNAAQLPQALSSFLFS